MGFLTKSSALNSDVDLIDEKTGRANTRIQPKLQLACQKLEQLASQLGPGMRLPKVQELRSEVGVSLTTLNTAFEVLEGRGILQRRNGIGVFVAAKTKHNIALLCDPSFFEGSSHSPLWGTLVRSLRQWAEREGESLEFHFARIATPKNPPLPQALVKALAENRVQGVLALGLHLETMQWLHDREIPTVGFACWGDERSHLVSYDHDIGFFAQGAAILREAGCRKVELWRPIMTWLWPQYPQHKKLWREHMQNTERDWAVFSAFFESASLRFCPELLESPHLVLSQQEQGYKLAREVFTQLPENWPDGLLFWDDMLAHGALMALDQLGIKRGANLVVVSQANEGSPTLERELGEITLLEFNPRQAVETMFNQLEALLSGDSIPPGVVHIPFQCRNLVDGLEKPGGDGEAV